MRFRVVYRGRKLTVSITHRNATYRLEHGEPLDIRHHGRQVTVGDQDLTLEIPPAPKVDRVRQPAGCEPRRRSRAGTPPVERPSAKDSERLR
jgi:alpha,alpha-trehalose phosphorylase